MHGGRTGAAQLSRLNPFVFGEVGFDRQILISHDAFRRYSLFGNGEQLIGFADAPALEVFRRGRHGFRVALFRTAIYPGGNRVQFGLREAAVILPRA